VEPIVVYPVKRMFGSLLIWAMLAGAVACVSAPPRTANELQADKETADRVVRALNADKYLFTRHISVRADSGVVHLGGYVWSPTDIYEAKRIARRVPGVTVVVNELELKSGGIR
jgi:osmotically-inducible protein OsmY